MRSASYMFLREIVDTAKEYASITLGILALVVASAAAYVMFSGNNPIQGKPENQQVATPDYSSQLNSLKSQVDSINSQISSISNNTLPTLDNVKSSITDIRGKLTDLASMKNNLTNIQQRLVGLSSQNNQVQQVTTSAPTKITMILDKGAYSLGDTIHITAIGADPLKPVQVELLDNNGYVVTHKVTWADSTGSILYDLQTDSTAPLGNYQVKLISDQDTETQPITLVPSTSPYGFTAQTDKGIYLVGDAIQVSGTTSPSTLITGTMTSPSGVTYASQTTANIYGTYTMYFSTSASFETGNYNISVTSLGQTRTLSVYLQLGSFTGTYTFTTNTDKAVYQAGDVIEVSGTAQPHSDVTAALASPSGTTYNEATTANDFGSYTMTFSTTTSFQTGNYNIDVSNLGQTRTLSVYLQLGNSYTFTTHTDKSVYQTGDLIEVSGIAQPNSAVSAVMTSPSGKTFTSGATAGSDGTYTIFFSSALSYEAGTWYINVTNLARTTVLNFTMQLGSSSFTAYTDKGIYTAGDVIEVKGTAEADSTVTASLSSPSGVSYSPSSTTSNIYGGYSISFATTRSFETGNWHVILGNLGQTTIVSIFIEPP
jgi:uncharacterized protein YoxC